MSFYMTDETAHRFYLIGFVGDLPLCAELLFEYDHQFNNIEQVESKILAQVRVIVDTFDIDAHMLRDMSADFGCKKSFFLN